MVEISYMVEVKSKVYDSPFAHHEVKANHMFKTMSMNGDIFSCHEGGGTE